MQIHGLLIVKVVSEYNEKLNSHGLKIEGLYFSCGLLSYLYIQIFILTRGN